jgi:hypothetical protein
MQRSPPSLSFLNLLYPRMQKLHRIYNALDAEQNQYALRLCNQLLKRKSDMAVAPLSFSFLNIFSLIGCKSCTTSTTPLTRGRTNMH